MRSHSQRRADALAELITTEARPAAEDPAQLKPHPRFMVHLFYNLTTGTLQTADGEALPPHLLAEIGPDAEIVGHVFNGDGQPLWLGRSKRLASRGQWLALIARDRGCDDCAAPITTTEAHHPHQWEHGGPTDIDNLELKCHSCHGNEHRGQRRPDRRPSRAA